MRHRRKERDRGPLARGRKPGEVTLLAGLALALALATSGTAWAGKLSWMDEVVQEVVREARAGGRAAVRNGDTTAHAAGRLFVHEADEGLEVIARRSEDLARVGRRVERPSEALLQKRFVSLMRNDPEAARTFSTLAPAEKRLV